MSKKILFVDDETAILKSLKRLFMDADYEIFLAEGGEEALQFLSAENIDLLFTDVKMPGMDGYKLLEKVKKKYPLIIRVILSGYTEGKEIVEAIQKNLARTYILKPWNNEELLKFIEDTFEIQKLLKNKNNMNKFNNIPTLIGSYNRIKTLIEEKSDMEEIAKTIEEDQAIAAKVLHIANSAFYGVKTASIKQAITYLGSDNVEKIVLSTSIFNQLKDNDKITSVKKPLWNHASLTNKVLTFFYENLLNQKIPKWCETAGLLHDIGKVIILTQFPKEYETMLNNVNYHGNGKEDLEVEKSIIGNSHEEIGGYALYWWGLPYAMVEAALFHHHPLDEKVLNKNLVSMVHLANYYAWTMVDGVATCHLDMEIFDFLGITKTQCDGLIKKLKIK
ncbi:response regulator [Clostridium formicaceticum]|uniref:Stage 0 sporulation protein A homolog n=1 Tax=Clostridium formicaceticum TaxID=1497 RepID=A0AAC9WHB3_9CLOT|nr:response regulator [Clostridium formicaceticum]AOY77027.1 hypothetical protein BJL90_14910 [Clostridium formicaceticum]ARE87525.1 Hydrogenase transcriptional regulatory protein hupR1 [Clostridium formicaceticum]